jgi:hypothetical protein
MPRYFFHVEEGDPVRDQDGTEFADQLEARKGAVIFLADLVRWNPKRFWIAESLRVTVTDESRLTLYILDLSAIASSAVRRT